MDKLFIVGVIAVWEKFQHMMEQDQFSNDMFWWLRK